MAAEAQVTAYVEVKAAPLGLLDVLHVVSAHFPVEGNIAVGICQEAWRDVRIWMAIIDMKHKPKKANGEVDIEAPRLVIASRKGRLDVVQRLLDLNANIEAKSDVGSTALIWACRYGHEHVASFLLDKHANIDALNNNNFSALWYACNWANVDIARLLLARGANVDLGDPPFLKACQELHEDDRAEVDMSTFWARRSLVDHNANLNVVDANGWTAIMLTIKYNQAAIIELLLDRHVDIDALNNDNRSALNLACCFANVEAARLLLARGANVDLGDPPILEACGTIRQHDKKHVGMSTFWARRCEIVIELVHHNADLDVVDADGRTPVQLAEKNHQRAIVAVLCEALGMSDEDEEEEEEEQDEDE